VPPAQRSPAPPPAPRSPIARYSSCSTGKRQLRAQKLQVAPPPREARAPVRRIAAQHPRRALPAHAARPCPPPHARPPRPVCGLLRSAPAYTPHPACAPAASSRSPTPFSPGGAGTPQLARRGRGDGPRAARAACRRAPPPDEDRTEAATVRCPAQAAHRPRAPSAPVPPRRRTAFALCIARAAPPCARARRRAPPRVVVACPRSLPSPLYEPTASRRLPTSFSPGGAGTPWLPSRGRGNGPRVARALPDARPMRIEWKRWWQSGVSASRAPGLAYFGPSL